MSGTASLYIYYISSNPSIFIYCHLVLTNNNYQLGPLKFVQRDLFLSQAIEAPPLLAATSEHAGDDASLWLPLVNIWLELILKGVWNVSDFEWGVKRNGRECNQNHWVYNLFLKEIYKKQKYMSDERKHIGPQTLEKDEKKGKRKTKWFQHYYIFFVKCTNKTYWFIFY